MNATSSAQPKTSPQAVWSLILGVLSNTCLWIFGSIPAIILGILAIKKIDRNPQEIGGKGIALAGIVTGAVGIIVGLTVVAMAAAIITPAVSVMSRNAKLTKQADDIRQLAYACLTYAADTDGKFPPDLETLVDEGYLDTDELLMTEDLKSGERVPYEYNPGLANDSPRSPLILGPIAPTGTAWGKRMIGYSDGSVDSVRISETGETLELNTYE